MQSRLPQHPGTVSAQRLPRPLFRAAQSGHKQAMTAHPHDLTTDLSEAAARLIARARALGADAADSAVQ